jgi:CHAT domain-containing protein
MGHPRLVKRTAVPLLTLLLLGAAAAAPTADQAARDARSALDRSSLDEAQRIIDDALQRFGTRNDETIWLLRVMRAEVLQVRGNQEDARTALKQELPSALQMSEPAVRRLLILGNVAIHLRETKEAARQYEQARAVAAAHQPQMLGECYAALAITASDLKRVEHYANQAIAAARRAGKARPEAQALAVLQWRYTTAERYVDAVSTGEKALALAQSQKDDRRVQQAAGNLGWAYIAIGDYESAAELFAFAETTAARIGAEGDRIPWLVQLGNLRVQKYDWQGAEKYYLAALPRARHDEHRDLGFVLANLATVSFEMGRLEDARRYNAEALVVKRKTGDKESELRSFIIDARIAAAGNDIAKATAILNDIARQAKLKTTQWEARGRLAEVFVKANQVDDANRQFRLAIDTVRKARHAIDNTELQLSFFNLTADIFSAYLDFLISQKRLKGALDATEEIRVDALDDALDEKTHSRAVDARAIAKQQNATILSYWLGPRQSYVWKITANEIRVAKLASDSTITMVVDAYRRELTDPRGRLELSRVRGQKLYDLLGKPRGSRVIIIPDGSLHSINFETLVVPGPRPHYWIEDALVTEASSIRVLAQERRVTNRPASLLLVGNPPSSDPLFPPLRYAGDEMRSIAKHFPSHARVLEGAAATADAYRSASPQQYDYVHFVAHGTASRTRPLESAVILAGGKLPARDVVKQKLAARLVTISSCHGAGARAYTAEGLVGLAWAFRRAGAESVIAALWEVNDSATPQLMDRFYEKTAAGVDPAAALRDAKLFLLNSGRAVRYARYWAPFVYYE